MQLRAGALQSLSPQFGKLSSFIDRDVKHDEMLPFKCSSVVTLMAI